MILYEHKTKEGNAMTINIKADNDMRITTNTFTTVELMGSEKQVEWASSIRADFAACLSFTPIADRDEMTMKVIAWMFENVSDSARYIENRLPRGANSTKLDMQKAVQQIVGMDAIKNILA